MAMQITVMLTKNLHWSPKIPPSNAHIPNLSLCSPSCLIRFFSSQNSELKKKNKQQLALKNGVVKCSMEYNNNNNVNNGQYYEYERQVMGQAQYPRPSEIEWKKEICNSVQLIGIVGTPVQIKHLTSGKVLAWSRLAVKKSSTDTAWINLTFWDELAHVAFQHVEKGQQIYVSGRLVSDTVEGDDGKQQTYYKVVVSQLNFVERSVSPEAFYDGDSNSGRRPKNFAVKKLNSESMQGYEEWQSEVNFLGRLSHPNLVKLVGYCWEDEELLLVYEFMQKGSLENHLFGRGSAVQPLPWEIRLKILIGAARGLAFLHASEKQIIYRDFKASNILLDGSYHAKLSDFGLAKIGPSASKSHVTTRVMGTYGYAAPEYVATGHLYVKSDVYGFGVVLVEMLTGLRALDTNRPTLQHNLVDWIKPYLADKRKLKNIMDSRLEGKYPSRAAVLIAQLALTCLGPEPKTRPGMKEVVETLERVEAVNEKPRAPRIHSAHKVSRHGQQPLHHLSPLHARQDGNQVYQLPSR